MAATECGDCVYYDFGAPNTQFICAEQSQCLIKVDSVGWVLAHDEHAVSLAERARCCRKYSVYNLLNDSHRYLASAKST
jgi:hypothetical protein